MTKKAAAPSIRFKGFSDAWEQRKVGDFYDFKNGLNKGKAFFGKGTPIVNFTDVFHKRGITTQMLRGRVTLTPSEISNYGVKQGDIFVTRTSETIEEIGYASVMLDSPKDTVFSGFVLRGRAIKEDPLTLKFKQFVFSTDAFRSEMIKKSSMTTRALTSGTAIKKMYFQYPVSTEEQNRIGQFLESLDHLITLHQRKYEKLTNVKKSMLEKMFPQNGSSYPEIRFKGFTDPWEQRKVGDFYDFKNGLNKGKAFFGKGTPIVNFTDVFHKRGITTQMLRGRVTLTPSEISNYGVKQGDIFVTRTSETIEEIGYASVMLDSPKDTVFSGFVLRGRAIKEDPLTLKFKQFVFSTDAFRSEMIKKSSMTTRALTSGTAIKKMYFQYPVSTEEQNRIGQFLESLDHLITLHQRELEKLQNIKKSMLEKMFV